MWSIEATRAHYPVGKGLFHSGRIALVDGDRRETFRYVYDCGSRQRERLAGSIFDLRNELEREGRPVVDMLVLSQLGMDYSNGVEELIEQVHTETVVLPYLHEWGKVWLLFEAAARHADHSTLDLLVDPATWFRQRGVKRVVFVRPPSEFDAGLAADFPTALQHVGHGPMPTLAPAWSDIAPHAEIESGAFVALGEHPVWAFSPFCHAEPDGTPSFAQHIEASFGPISSQELREVIRSGRKDPQLAACFKQIQRNADLTSLCLYSGPSCRFGSAQWEYAQGSPPSRPYARGPIPAAFEQLHGGTATGSRRQLFGAGTSPTQRPPVGILLPGDVGVPRLPARAADRDRLRGMVVTDATDARLGWLGTGDSNLKAARRQQTFANHYAALLERTGAFQLPHFGSRASFEPDGLPELADCIWISSADGSRYFPDGELLQELGARGQVVQVDKRPGSGFYERIRLAAS